MIGPVQRALPQRAAAIRAMHEMSEREGCTLPPHFRELSMGRRKVQLRGHTPDGRRFAIGYEWTEEQVAAYAQ